MNELLLVEILQAPIQELPHDILRDAEVYAGAWRVWHVVSSQQSKEIAQIAPLLTRLANKLLKTHHVTELLSHDRDHSTGCNDVRTPSKRNSIPCRALPA